MIEQPDLLAERFAALTNPLDDSDWLDVRRRARAVSRRWLLIPLAAAIAAVAVGSAFALYRELVDFGSAEPAPERIQRDFDFLREHTAEASSTFGGPKYTTDGPAREVMRVNIDGEARPLWVVPTREGGFCYRLHFLGSCLTLTTSRRGASASAASQRGTAQVSNGSPEMFPTTPCRRSNSSTRMANASAFLSSGSHRRSTRASTRTTCPSRTSNRATYPSR